MKDKSSQGGRGWKERKQINKQKYRQSLAQQPRLGGLGGCQGSPHPPTTPQSPGDTEGQVRQSPPTPPAQPSCWCRVWGAGFGVQDSPARSLPEQGPASPPLSCKSTQLRKETVHRRTPKTHTHTHTSSKRATMP